MAFRIRVGEAASDAVKRMLAEQLDAAMEHLAGASPPDAEAVHEVRKNIKRIRALLRLVRDRLGAAYDAENRFFRQAARRLSDVRDADAAGEAFDRLIGTSGRRAQRFAVIRERLVAARSSDTPATPDSHTLLADFRAARRRISAWPLRGKGFGVIGPGLRNTYRQARRAFKKARGHASVENLHEWRKRVKAHGYQMRVLEPLWPAVMNVWREELDVLGELLGDDHDLAILAHRLSSLADEIPADLAKAFCKRIDRRRKKLQRQALALGSRIHAESPSCFESRLRRWWRAWWNTASPRRAHRGDDAAARPNGHPDGAVDRILTDRKPA